MSMSHPATLPSGLPGRPLVAWIGDDLTGAAAVAETLAFAGLPAALFLDPPDAATLARFPGLMGVGLASTARAETPAWMDANLPAAFAWLKATGAPVIHYKTCSTLDSAPGAGSIGRALELGLAATGASAAPMLFAAPEFGRFQAFGHLFAAGEDGVHRLDRHPVMARHPVTPMDESDVCRHLARQTALRLVPLMRPDLSPEGYARAVAAGARGVALDCVGRDDLTAAGRVLLGAGGQSFVLGSQGVESALVAHLLATGWLSAPPPRPRPARVGRIAVVSGSASATTARQIAHAERAGWPVFALDAPALFGPGRDAAIDAASAFAARALAHGASPVVAAARGPDDPALSATRAAIAAAGLSPAEGEARVGHALAEVLSRLDAPRALVAGGDTAGRVARGMGLVAIEPLGWIAHGASLMRATRADGSATEIILKGGQMGPEDLFARALGATDDRATDGRVPRKTTNQGDTHDHPHRAA